MQTGARANSFLSPFGRALVFSPMEALLTPYHVSSFASRIPFALHRYQNRSFRPVRFSRTARILGAAAHKTAQIQVKYSAIFWDKRRPFEKIQASCHADTVSPGPSFHHKRTQQRTNQRRQGKHDHLPAPPTVYSTNSFAAVLSCTGG